MAKRRGVVRKFYRVRSDSDLAGEGFGRSRFSYYATQAEAQLGIAKLLAEKNEAVLEAWNLFTGWEIIQIHQGASNAS
jgi:hypothetical protein